MRPARGRLQETFSDLQHVASMKSLGARNVPRHMVLVHAFGVRIACGNSQGSQLLQTCLHRSSDGVAERDSNPNINNSNPRLGYNKAQLLGIGQVVRHMVLVHAFGGSNPSTPAKMSMFKIDHQGLFSYACINNCRV